MRQAAFCLRGLGGNKIETETQHMSQLFSHLFASAQSRFRFQLLTAPRVCVCVKLEESSAYVNI